MSEIENTSLQEDSVTENNVNTPSEPSIQAADAPSSVGDQNRCPQCGAENDASAAFCALCGGALSAPAKPEKKKRRKSRKVLLIISIVCIVLFAGIAVGFWVWDNFPAVETLTIAPEKVTLCTGNTQALTFSYEPEDARFKLREWSSDNTDVATVSEDGTVTAVAPGTCTVTLTSKNKKTASCEVYVRPFVDHMTMNQENVTLWIGKAGAGTTRLAFKYFPEDADFTLDGWTSSNKAVATVNDAGDVIAVAPGTCTITASSANGKTAVCNITVKEYIKNFRELFSSYAGKTWCQMATDGSYMQIDDNPLNLTLEFMLYIIDADPQLWQQWSAIEDDADNAIKSINQTLGFGSALWVKMGKTTSAQGRQTEENAKYRVSWTYHPDKGLEVLYEMKAMN